MRTLLSGCFTVIASCCAFAAAACETPAMVTIPDGKTATEPQMLTAQADVKAYVAAMNEYVACIDEELEAKGNDAPEQYKALMVARHNAAVTEIETVAAAFNDQIKAYRAASSAPAAN